MLVVAALSFALISIFTIIATRAGTTLNMFLLIRFAVATSVLAPLAWREPADRLDPTRYGRIVVVGGIGQALIAVLTLASLQWIPAATLVVLFYTFPAWVTLLAAVRRTEPLTPARIGALLLSLSGIVALVGWPGADAIHPTGAALALGAAFIYAIYVPVIGRLQHGMSSTRATSLIAAGVTLVFAVVTLARGEFALTIPGNAWAAAVATGVFSTALGLVLFMRGLAVLGPVRTSIICTVEPIFAAGLAALILGQPITVPMMMGGGLILAAVLLLTGQPADRSR
jgi:drug/metabolite transporter (DMT)-like permease